MTPDQLNNTETGHCREARSWIGLPTLKGTHYRLESMATEAQSPHPERPTRVVNQSGYFVFLCIFP